MSKTVEFQCYVGDFVWYIDESSRSFKSDKVESITIGESTIYITKNTFMEFCDESIGETIFLEKPTDYAGEVVVKNKLEGYIGKPLFDTFTKEWVLLSDKTEEFVVFVDAKNNMRSISLTGYGSCWGLSETES